MTTYTEYDANVAYDELSYYDGDIDYGSSSPSITSDSTATSTASDEFHSKKKPRPQIGIRFVGLLIKLISVGRRALT